MTNHNILSVQSVSVNSKAASSNPAYGDVDSIPHYVIKFVSGKSVVFSWYSGFPHE
jgi:hypothetical protein